MLSLGGAVTVWWEKRRRSGGKSDDDVCAGDARAGQARPGYRLKLGIQAADKRRRQTQTQTDAGSLPHLTIRDPCSGLLLSTPLISLATFG
jgi:hypothetical protein